MPRALEGRGRTLPYAECGSGSFPNGLARCGCPIRLCRVESATPNFLRTEVGLSQDQIEDIRAGIPVVKTFPARSPTEIFLFGAIYIHATPESFLQHAPDFDRMRRNSRFLALGVFGKLGPSSMEMAQFSVALPQQMRRVLGDIARGNFAIGLREDSLEPFALRLENLANRMVLSILAGAFIVGSAVLLSFYHPQGWEQWAGQLLRFDFLIATALSLYLAWRISRSHRK